MRAPRRFAALAIVGAYHKRDSRLPCELGFRLGLVSLGNDMSIYIIIHIYIYSG